LELDENEGTLTEDTIAGAFNDGDTIEFTSVVATDVTSTEIPVFIELSIFALNAAGETIKNLVSVLFTNVCGESTLIEGGSIGWARFVRYFNSLLYFIYALVSPFFRRVVERR